MICDWKVLITRKSDTVIELHFHPFIINYPRVMAASFPLTIDDSRKAEEFLIECALSLVKQASNRREHLKGVWWSLAMSFNLFPTNKRYAAHGKRKTIAQAWSPGPSRWWLFISHLQALKTMLPIQSFSFACRSFSISLFIAGSFHS